MAQWKKTWGVYDPSAKEPFRLSRSKIDLFLGCARCFYLDRRLGIRRPDMPAFTLNNAVDALLKKEFDILRKKGKPHPIFLQYKVDLVPLDHPKMDEWRDALKRGITFHHKKTNLTITGGVDDVWKNAKGELVIADYKATAKEEEITTLESVWHESYKRQMEVYQWLFRQNGFPVSETGYILYANGNVGEGDFSETLKFRLTLIPHVGKTDWIEPTITRIKATLDGDLPPVGEGKNTKDGICPYCSYRQKAAAIEIKPLRTPGRLPNSQDELFR